MTESERRRSMSRRGLVGGASAAIISQGIVAASSLGLQLIALAELGNAGLGTYALLATGLMVTATALHTGWVGDPLVLLDRFAPDIRRALVGASLASMVLSFLFGLVGALLVTSVNVATAALFGAALVVWLIEETGRRLLMARLEFAKLVVNDAIYGVVALGLTVGVMVAGDLTMNWILTAMAAGSVASIVAALVQLPAEELALPSRGPVAWRTLSNVSTWRSGQLMMRPFGMLLVRWSVSFFVSTAALGVMEAGRLVTAPILTAANGIGGFTLPFFTRTRDAGSLGVRLVLKFTAVSTAVAVLYVPVALLVAKPFEQLSDSDPIPLVLTLSWAIYAIAYAANIPVVNALTSLLHSRLVFVGRVIDSAFIVAVSIVVVLVDGVRFVPIVMALGIVLGTAYPLWRLRREGAFDDPERIAMATLPSVSPRVG